MSRRTYFRLHQAVGLVAAAFVLVLAVTGGLLSLREQIKHEVPKAEPVAEPIALEEIVARAVAAGDGSPATDIAFPTERTQPYTVWLDDDAETEVYLDGRGRVLGTHRGSEGLTRVLFLIHTGEIVGPLGSWLSIVVALGLLTLVGSGLTMVWLRRRARRPVA